MGGGENDSAAIKDPLQTFLYGDIYSTLGRLLVEMNFIRFPNYEEILSRAKFSAGGILPVAAKFRLSFLMGYLPISRRRDRISIRLQNSAGRGSTRAI